MESLVTVWLVSQCKLCGGAATALMICREDKVRRIRARKPLLAWLLETGLLCECVTIYDAEKEQTVARPDVGSVLGV